MGPRKGRFEVYSGKTACYDVDLATEMCDCPEATYQAGKYKYVCRVEMGLAFGRSHSTVPMRLNALGSPRSHAFVRYFTVRLDRATHANRLSVPLKRERSLLARFVDDLRFLDALIEHYAHVAPAKAKEWQPVS